MFPSRVSIHPLSVRGQCLDRAATTRIIRNLFMAVEFLAPLLDRGIVEVLYDSRIEVRCLHGDEVLITSISCMPDTNEDPDLRRLWFRLRDRLFRDVCDEPRVNIAISCSGNADTISGDVDPAMLRENPHWLSFYPKYEHNPKHGSREKTYAGGKRVSPMRLSEPQARDLLRYSIHGGGRARWAYDRPSQVFYEFKGHLYS